jgi:MarR family transcriptional regulator, transcriptional regulator for hemolysin
MIVAPDLMMLFNVASHTLETELTARLATIGVTPRANCVLVRAMQQERTQTELAELCNLDKTTMVVTLDALESAGLAERRLSSTDRRARIIAVTRAGADLVARAESVITEIYREVLDSLPSDERKAFVAALTRLAQGRLSTPVPCEKPPRRRAARPPEPVK